MDDGLVLDTRYGFKITGEKSLNSVSTYVVLEQDGWFETEMGFFDLFLKPGMRVIDIGANIGFYTLQAACKVGGNGRVWSFEPGPMPASLLRNSLLENNLQNVSLREMAVGETKGHAWLAENVNSELSRVESDKGDNARQIEVETLDHLMMSEGFSSIDFVKIDAEGFEEAIVRGGREFFATCNPIVMLEVSDRKPEASQLLAEMGYLQFRYLPLLGCLIPHDWQKANEGHLNILFLRADRAAALHREGLIMSFELAGDDYPAAQPQEFNDWFASLPVVASSTQLTLIAGGKAAEAYRIACAEFLRARNQSLPLAERFARLMRARKWADERPREAIPLEEALSMTAIYLAVKIFQVCSPVIMESVVPAETAPLKTLKLTKPFLMLADIWEKEPVKQQDVHPWISAMILREFDMYHAYSSFYDAPATLAVYQYIAKSGYMDEMLERRAVLITKRFGLILGAPLMYMADYAGLNAEIMRQLLL